MNSNTAWKAETAGPLRVLIVDDQPAMRGALRYLVSLCLPQASIVELAEGAQVRVRAKALQPDLVLMDVQLPDANGIDLTRALRGFCPHAKVVVVSIDGSRANALRAREAGAFAFISKERLYADLQPLLVALRDGAGAGG